MTYDVMRSELCRVVKALQTHKVKLIIGGGYGLILRNEYIQKNNFRTRFEEIPLSRSTNDFDVFLSAEIISDAEKLGKFRDVLHELGYTPIESAKYYQFRLPILLKGLENEIKIDLLASPILLEENKAVKIDSRRIKRTDTKEIHAHVTPEALSIEDNLLPINISESDEVLQVFVPHPFSYLLMKLFALNDRLHDKSKDFGAYHAFDIYTIIALITESEWSEMQSLNAKYAETPILQTAQVIVKTLFSEIDSTGIIRIREHLNSINQQVPNENLNALIEDLQAIFL